VHVTPVEDLDRGGGEPGHGTLSIALKDLRAIDRSNAKVLLAVLLTIRRSSPPPFPRRLLQ
jgi:hypothetical protein